MMRTLTALIVALATVCIAAAAQAQVAAPSLVPAAPSVIDPVRVPDANFTTSNPAAMQWSTTGRMGFGQIRSQRDVPPPAEDESWDGYHVGLRWLGESWGLGLERVSLNRNEPNADLNTQATNVAISLGVNDLITIGGALDNGERDNGFRDEITGNTLGVSLRFQEQFFFGAAFGNDRLEHTNGTDYDDSRGVSRFGIGMRTEGEVMWHLEYNWSDKDSWDTPGGGNVGGESATQAVIEANVSTIVLGARFHNIKYTDADETVDAQVFDVGWAPESGLSVIGHLEQTTIEDDNTGDTTDISSTAISVAYLF